MAVDKFRNTVAWESNGVISIFEWIAMGTMLIDHLTYSYFEEYEIGRMIGRIAFPLYAYLIILGLGRTKNRKKYLKRLFVIALLSQVPYYLVFDNGKLNVVFTLWIAACLLHWFEQRKESKRALAVLIIIGLIAFLFSSHMDYSLYGIALCVIYYASKTKWYGMILLHFSLNVLEGFFYSGEWWTTQDFSLIGTLIIVLANKVKMPQVYVPRGLYRLFYPAHLLMLSIINSIIEGSG